MMCVAVPIDLENPANAPQVMLRNLCTSRLDQIKLDIGADCLVKLKTAVSAPFCFKLQKGFNDDLGFLKGKEKPGCIHT